MDSELHAINDIYLNNYVIIINVISANPNRKILPFAYEKAIMF